MKKHKNKFSTKFNFVWEKINLSFIFGMSFLFLVLYTSSLKAQISSNVLCPHNRLIAEIPSNQIHTGCMLKEVEFHFSPFMDSVSTEFQTCNLKIKGEVVFKRGVGSLISVPKQLKDKDNNEITVHTNGNQFEVDDTLIRTFKYRTSNKPDKYAFSLLIMATPGTEVSVQLTRVGTSRPKDLTTCDLLYFNFCYFAEAFRKQQTLIYTFDYTMEDNNSNDNIKAPISVNIDYAHPKNTTETLTEYNIFAKNTTNKIVTLQEASFVIKKEFLTINNSLNIEVLGNLNIEDIGNGCNRFYFENDCNNSNNLNLYPNQSALIGKLTLSAPLPIRYAESTITYKPNTGYIKYKESSVEHCCQSELNSGSLKLNENIGYPSCINNDVTFRVSGSMASAKKAAITIYAKSKNAISLNHLWVNLRLNMPSSWSFDEQNLYTCPGSNQSCSYNHTNTSNCTNWTHNPSNSDIWNAEFGYCTSGGVINLPANTEVPIGYIYLRNQVSCSSDQISIEPMFVQYGTNTTNPCVPEVKIEGFPLLGTDYNVSGNMNFICTKLLTGQSGLVNGINVYEKPNNTCGGDCYGDCALSCYNSGTVYPIAVDPSTKFYNSVCRESSSPMLSIEPCKSDNARQFVSTADLVAINKHILGIETFNVFNQYFAGDVNHDLKVSTSDMVKLRKVILFIEEDFSPSTYWSWRFITYPMTFQILNGFPSPSDPQGCQQANYGAKKSLDYYAIKIGDVNNCYSIINNNTPTFTETDNPTYQIGNVVKIKIKAGATFSLEGLQAGLHFNPAQLTFTGINQNGVSTPLLITNPDNVGSTQASTGKLRILWYDDQGGAHNFQNGENIIELQFTALQTISSTTNLVQLDDTILESIGYNNDSQHSHISLNGQNGFSANSEDRSDTSFKKIGMGYEIMEVDLIPNPSNNAVQLKLNTPENGNYIIKIMDESGRTVLNYNRKFEKGLNQCTIEGAERLSKGLYFFSILSPSGAAYNTKLIRQ